MTPPKELCVLRGSRVDSEGMWLALEGEQRRMKCVLKAFDLLLDQVNQFSHFEKEKVAEMPYGTQPEVAVTELTNDSTGTQDSLSPCRSFFPLHLASPPRQATTAYASCTLRWFAFRSPLSSKNDSSLERALSTQ